jgi:hypothetical protein
MNLEHLYYVLFCGDFSGAGVIQIVETRFNGFT